MEFYGAEQGMDFDGAAVVDCFAWKRGGVVGDELAVVEQLFDEVPRVAQVGFKPLGQGFLVFPVGEFLVRLGEEVFGFAAFFSEALGLEVFFSVVFGAAVETRRSLVCWRLSWADWPQSCAKR